MLIGQGQMIAQVTKQRGVTEQTYFRWRKSHGGLRIDQAKRLRELAAQNARLKRAVSDLTVDKLILQRSRRGNYSARVRCREAVALVRAKHAYSERRIC
ncbi:MAG: transposase, partial [Gammaproteobacteria bacterium]|nr:transposase [Gammaproteobacteria bacterium]